MALPTKEQVDQAARDIRKVGIAAEEARGLMQFISRLLWVGLTGAGAGLLWWSVKKGYWVVRK